MATVTLASLFQTYTKATMTTLHLESLHGAGFPTTFWGTTSVPRKLVEASADAVLGLANLIPTIAAGGLVSEAVGDWLTLLASSNYDEERDAAVATRRTLRLTDSTASPTTIAVGDLWVATDEGLRFRNIEGGTLAASSTIDLEFEAEEAGADYNAASATWTFDTSTALPGVAISEPTVDITRSGADEESDTSLKAKCYAKWATLGAGANNDAYVYLAKNTPGIEETITKVKVLDSTPSYGQVTVYVGTDAGPASGASVTLIQDYIDPTTHLGKAPNCVDVIVAAPTSSTLNFAGIVYVSSSEYSTDVLAALGGILSDIVQEANIGDTIYKAEIIQRIMDLDGVVNVALTAPVGDTVLGTNTIAAVGTVTSVTVSVV
jgi:uncharacterized phage protein gp47/JayE